VRRCAAHRPLWCWTEGVGASSRAMRAPWRDPGHTATGGRPRRRPWRQGGIAPGGKRDERRRVGATESRLVDGPPARVETLRRRSQGDGGSHTASMERRNAPLRPRRAPLARRGRALARQPRRLEHGLYLLGTVYNCCTEHASLRLAAQAPGTGALHRTPAMAAGITDHGWTVRALLAFQVPPPRWAPPQQRGRPSRALQRLIERGCA
jgi:hypothetical protein